MSLRKFTQKFLESLKFKYHIFNFFSSKYKKKGLPNKGVLNWGWKGGKNIKIISNQCCTSLFLRLNLISDQRHII